MQFAELQDLEKRYLKGRMVLFGLFSVVLLGIGGLLAHQAVEDEAGFRYAWVAGLILLMVFFVGSATLFFHRLLDLLDGKKRIMRVEVAKKEDQGNKQYLWFMGKRHRVSREFFDQVEQEGALELHFSKKGSILASIPLPKG